MSILATRFRSSYPAEAWISHLWRKYMLIMYIQHMHCALLYLRFDARCHVMLPCLLT